MADACEKALAERKVPPELALGMLGKGHRAEMLAPLCPPCSGARIQRRGNRDLLMKIFAHVAHCESRIVCRGKL